MRFRPRLKTVVLGVGMALAAGSVYAGPWGAPSQGDSGQGVDTVIANGLNPRGLDTSLTKDANGLGPFRSPVSHTPTGQMYSVPWAEPAEGNIHGDVEFGVIGSFGDHDAGKFNEYRDMSSGVTINNFNFSAESPTTQNYFKFFGGGVGRDDQYYGGEIGCYNCWRVRFFYNETPHVFATDAHFIWNGAGTNALTLKPGLQFTGVAVAAPGANQNPNAVQINSELRANVSGNDELALYRKKGGLRFDMPLWNNWSFYANYTLEKRTGDRDFGTSGGGFPGASLINAAGGTGQPIEIIEPIDYRSHEFRTGLSYADDWNALNLSFAVSIFQDAIKRMTFENPNDSPYTNTTTGVFTNRHTQYISTPPDNQAYTLNLDYQRALPWWNSSFNATASYSYQRQNDDLMPYTTATGYGGVVPVGYAYGGPGGAGGLAQNDDRFWNSLVGPNGLPTTTRNSADLDNKVSLLNFGLTTHPTSQLTVSGKLRWYDFDAENSYLACNPSLAAYYGTTCTPGNSLVTTAGTNVAVGTPAPIYGYLYEDGPPGGGQGVEGDNGAGLGAGGKVRSFDVGFRQLNKGLSADWAFAPKMSVNLAYERENVWRSERERNETWEDKFKVGFVDRGLFTGTLRASYEYDHKKGDPYNFQNYLHSLCADFYVNVAACNASLVSAAGVISTTERPPAGAKQDLADRDQHIIIGRYNYAFTNTLDGMVTAREKISLYPEALGVDSRHDTSASFELNFQPSTTTAMFAYYTYQQTNQSQLSVNGNSAYNAVTNPLGCNYAALVAGLCNQTLGAPYSIYDSPGATGNQIFRYDEDDKNHIFGIGLSHVINKVVFDSSYQFTRTHTDIDYLRYNAGITGSTVVGGGGAAVGVLAAPGSTTLTLGSPNAFTFPTNVYNRHQLNLSATMPLSANLGLRVYYMFDKVSAHDWHYDGLGALNDVTGAGRYYLTPDGTAEPYTAHTIGAFLQYKM